MSLYIHPSAEVDKSASIGDETMIWNNVQIRENASLGNHCIVSKDAYIDAGVSIGSFCKIQNSVSIYAGVSVADEVFIGPNACFTNDLFPRAINDEWEITKTVLHKGCSIGANATLICGVEIGEYSMVGAGSVVTQDIPSHALVVGNPSKVIGYVCKKGHRMNAINKSDYFCELCNEHLTLTNI
jgi:UDP-2-acetamido-3-amino-2,3-dideoxy-glucuronate N-acetyltransferase